MKILFFGDGEWATRSLSRLLADGVSVVGIVVRLKPTDPTLITVARTAGLPVFQPAKVNDVSFLDDHRKLSPDLNVSVSYDQIIRRPLLESAPKGFLNLHAGKLPEYRGRNVNNWALINGEQELGNTAHYMDEGIDTGDIVLQRLIPISRTDSYGTLLHKVIEEVPEVVSEAVRLIGRGVEQRRSQAHLLGSYFPAREDGDEWLEWSDTSENLYNKVRAITHPGPGAQTIMNGNRVRVWQAEYDPSWPVYKATPGQVVGRRVGEGVWVKTGDCTLFLRGIQIADNPVIVPSWPIGTRLGIHWPRLVESLQKRVEHLERLLENRD